MWRLCSLPYQSKGSEGPGTFNNWRMEKMDEAGLVTFACQVLLSPLKMILRHSAAICNELPIIHIVHRHLVSDKEPINLNRNRYLRTQINIVKRRSKAGRDIDAFCMKAA